MRRKKPRRNPKRVLRLPDLDFAKVRRPEYPPSPQSNDRIDLPSTRRGVVLFWETLGVGLPVGTFTVP